MQAKTGAAGASPSYLWFLIKHINILCLNDKMTYDLPNVSEFYTFDLLLRTGTVPDTHKRMQLGMAKAQPTDARRSCGQTGAV